MYNESHSQMAGLSARPAGRKGLQNRVAIVSPAANPVSHSALRQSGVKVAHTSHKRKRRNIAVPRFLINEPCHISLGIAISLRIHGLSELFRKNGDWNWTRPKPRNGNSLAVKTRNPPERLPIEAVFASRTIQSLDRNVPDRVVLAIGKSRPKKRGNVSPIGLDVVRDQWDR
jgi:hypothetical protein